MITHKIRIYPSRKLMAYFAEQFEYARRDYNRQLELALHGIASGEIRANNWEDSLKKIENYAHAHADFYHPECFHYPDIIRANAKIIMAKSTYLLSHPKGHLFRPKSENRSAFRVGAYPTDGHRFELKEKRLVLQGIGEIKMAEKPRYSSDPFRVEISCVGGRYYAAFLYAESHPLYPKTGKSIGLAYGVAPLLRGFDSEGRDYEADYPLKHSQHALRRIEHLRHLAECKGKNADSRRAKRNQEKLERAFSKQRFRRDDFVKKACHALAWHYDALALAPSEGLRKIYRRSASPWYRRRPFRELYFRLLAKAKIAGRHVKILSSEYPPRLRCSSCGGEINRSLPFSAKKWVCPRCGAMLDRVKNDAKNAWMSLAGTSP